MSDPGAAPSHANPTGTPAAPITVQSPVPNTNKWFRFDGTFSFGNILIVVGLFVTSYAAYIRNSERMETALRDISGLQSNVATQAEKAARLFAEQNQASREQQKELQIQFQQVILGLQASMSENIRRLEERAAKAEGALESRRDAVDQRLEQLSLATVANKADIAALLRASNVSLPGSPGMRR